MTSTIESQAEEWNSVEYGMRREICKQKRFNVDVEEKEAILIC